jgi:hypothetical protein
VVLGVEPQDLELLILFLKQGLVVTFAWGSLKLVIILPPPPE